MGGWCVVKVQIYVGGCGKGGGVKVVFFFDEVEWFVGEIFGMWFVMLQIGEEG